MQEVIDVDTAVALIRNRLAVIDEQIRLERCEGLEGDWTAIAEACESIESAGRRAARAAWIVQYEAAEAPE